METKTKKTRSSKKTFKSYLDYCLDGAGTIKKNGTLFLGLILFVSGMLSFQSGKYCEGNSADYYACTNPATYYYYSGYTILAVVIGVLLVTFWKLNHKDSS